MRRFFQLLSLLTLLPLSFFGQVQVDTLFYTGNMQTFVIPNGVDSVFMDIRGSEGEKASNGTGTAGKGGRTVGTLPVLFGDTLRIFVGGQCDTGSASFNGGGIGGASTSGPTGGCGGGASDIRLAGIGISNRVIVAGGGGGAGGYTGTNGGDGGGLIGVAGQNGAGGGGGGGTQSVGGTGGALAGTCGLAGMTGVAGIGGDGGGVTCGNGFGGGGGGGGGYFGGGGGGGAANLFCCPDWSGAGGGGSSWVDSSIVNPILTSGFQTGPGMVILHYENCPTPISGFSFSSSQLSATFTDTSSTNPTTWQWDFGDGNSDTLQNPNHQYSSAGTYTVCLTTSNSCGSDSTCAQVTIICPVPIASFTYSTNELSFSFSDSSANNPSSWFWDFGDGSTDTVQNPIHNYSTDTTVVTCLTVSNECGSDTLCQTLLLTQKPEDIAVNVSIYPNPTGNWIHIKIPANRFHSLLLTDLQGQTIIDSQSVRKEQESFRISVIGFAKGVYLLRLAGQEHSFSKKIVVQ